MENIERTHTHVFGPEEAFEKKREELNEPIDVMDVATIEKRIQEHPEDEKKILEESMEKFLSIHRAVTGIGKDFHLAVYARFLGGAGFLKNVFLQKKIRWESTMKI